MKAFMAKLTRRVMDFVSRHIASPARQEQDIASEFIRRYRAGGSVPRVPITPPDPDPRVAALDGWTPERLAEWRQRAIVSADAAMMLRNRNTAALEFRRWVRSSDTALSIVQLRVIAASSDAMVQDAIDVARETRRGTITWQRQTVHELCELHVAMGSDGAYGMNRPTATSRIPAGLGGQGGASITSPGARIGPTVPAILRPSAVHEAPPVATGISPPTTYRPRRSVNGVMIEEVRNSDGTVTRREAKNQSQSGTPIRSGAVETQPPPQESASESAPAFPFEVVIDPGSTDRTAISFVQDGRVIGRVINIGEDSAPGPVRDPRDQA